MNIRTLILALLASGLTLAPSQAFACRVGHDQHIFDHAPAPSMLPGAEVVRVSFSTEPFPLTKWPRRTPNPSGFDYSLIGVARVLDKGGAREKFFPVYAVVTSCSAFWPTLFAKAGPKIEGEHYLIGRFKHDSTGHRFLAGGVRNGKWHD